MKKRIILISLGVLILFIIIYITNTPDDEVDHPTLNVESKKPDASLRAVVNHAFAHEYDQSIYHLEKAIASIKTIESDVDLKSAELLEGAIEKLEKVKNEFAIDSLITADMNDAFEYALNSLAQAELRVSEMYAETNHQEQARLALSHAKMHVRNAKWQGDSKLEKIEQRVFLEIDSLIEDESISHIELTMKIDEIIKEMDQLLKAQGNN